MGLCKVSRTTHLAWLLSTSREIQTNCAIAGQYVSFIGSLLTIIVFICLSHVYLRINPFLRDAREEMDQGNNGEITQNESVLDQASV